jgi:hypothetical protein
MPIALPAVLGVDLIVIVVLVAGVLARKRWVSDQPGAFRGRSGSPAVRCRARDEVEARLWPLGPGDSRLGEGAVCSGMSWWWQMLLRALLARPSRVR